MAERIPFGVKKEHLKLVSPDMAEAKVTVQDAVTFRNVVRWTFRTNRNLEVRSRNHSPNESTFFWQKTEGEEALSRALLALRLLNTTYAKQLVETEKNRQEHMNTEGIDFAIGQVRQP